MLMKLELIGVRQKAFEKLSIFPCYSLKKLSVGLQKRSGSQSVGRDGVPLCPRQEERCGVRLSGCQ